MEKSIAPLLNHARDTVLLDGEAFSAVARAIKKRKLPELFKRIAPLRLFVAKPKDAFDDINDANYFVVDVEALRVRLIQPLSYVIVDVSPGSEPTVLKYDAAEYKLLAKKINMCKDAIELAMQQPTGLTYLLPEGELDSVILGALLGYPVLYMSRNPSSNSLSFTPLSHFSLREMEGRDPFASFSVPQCLLEHPEIKRALNAWQQAMKQLNVIIDVCTVCLPSISL